MSEEKNTPSKKSRKISGTDLSILSFVEENGPLKINDMAYDDSSMPVLETSLKKLQEMGYITKDVNDYYK